MNWYDFDYELVISRDTLILENWQTPDPKQSYHALS